MNDLLAHSGHSAGIATLKLNAGLAPEIRIFLHPAPSRGAAAATSLPPRQFVRKYQGCSDSRIAIHRLLVMPGNIRIITPFSRLTTAASCRFSIVTSASRP